MVASKNSTAIVISDCQHHTWCSFFCLGFLTLKGKFFELFNERIKLPVCKEGLSWQKSLPYLSYLVQFGARSDPYSLCTVPCCAVPCRAVPCRAVPCRAVPCRAVPCCAGGDLCRPVFGRGHDANSVLWSALEFPARRQL